jgi:hypothetical protein
MLRAGTFTGLDMADRRTLSCWLADAAGGHIDVVDFTPRPWNVSAARTILGVFEPGQTLASWLIVRHHTEWILIRRSDGLVMDVSVLLADVLALIAG